MSNDLRGDPLAEAIIALKRVRQLAKEIGCDLILAIAEEELKALGVEL